MISPCNDSLVGRLLGQESRIIAGIPRRMIQPVLNQFSTRTDDSQTFSFNSLYVSRRRTVASGSREREGASGDGDRTGSGSSSRKGVKGPLRHVPGRSFEAATRGRVRPGTTTLVGPSQECECIPDLGWEQSGGESAPAVAGVVEHLWARRSAGARPGRTAESVSWGRYEGRHKAGTYRELTGLKERSGANPSRAGARLDCGHQVGEACCRRGGVAGAEPPHKGGPNRPDRPELQ